MDADVREIYYYLKSWRHEFISVREICRRAGGKRKFRESAEWAKPVLARMMERGILEAGPGERYRLKPVPKDGDSQSKRWVSPQIAKILKDSGKNFNDVVVLDEPDDEY